MNNAPNVGKFNLPANLETEKALLACAISGNKFFSQMQAHIKPEYFFDIRHRHIFEAMYDLYANNQVIDMLTITDHLKKKGFLDSVGGINYIGEISQSHFYTSAIKDYCQTIKEKYQLRQMAIWSEDIYNRSIQEQTLAEDLMLDASQKIYELKQDNLSQGPRLVEEILQEQLAEISDEERLKNRNLKTGFLDFDQLFGGLTKGSLNIIAARPAMGKTAFALNIGRNCAMNHKVVAFFSLEMSQGEVVLRLFSAESMVENRKILNLQSFTKELPKLSVAIQKLNSQFKFFVDDRAGSTVVDIMSTCRQLKMQYGLDLIIIDYMQLISSAGKKNRENRQQEISDISRSLKLLAKDLHVPVIALSQLSRSCELRADKRPLLSDLRESGSIEQDADSVMFLFRPDYYQTGNGQEVVKKEVEEAELIIAKNRAGSTGSIKLLWYPKVVRFMDASNHGYDQVEPPSFKHQDFPDQEVELNNLAPPPDADSTDDIFSDGSEEDFFIFDE